jgi:serine/threonine-protein kinase
MLMGTADYIAPEQAKEASLVDTRGDIYSLGCSLYFLLTGHPPFQGGSIPQKILRHLETDPVPVQKIRPDVPDELAGVLAKMMAKDPRKRQQIPLLVVAEMRPFCAGSPGSSQGVLRTSHGSGASIRPPSTLSLKSSSIETAHTRPKS